MKNYIILNGISSTSLNGLIISTLPPISKPKIRVNYEEIDGVDGDIVNKLGYGAYDKSFEIGLSYNYNVDDIIKYFDSEGTVVFSNEPDKYYNYTIVGQIDFEKLIRFKTAKITMHVQPFKYSNVEGTKTFTFTEESQGITVRNNGNIFSKPIIKITGNGTINLYLNSIQALVINDLTDSIEINTQTMNAYNTTSGAFMNRSVSGDYSNLYLKAGANTLSWDGNITKIEISYCSRWI